MKNINLHCTISLHKHLNSCQKNLFLKMCSQNLCLKKNVHKRNPITQPWKIVA